ncbi:MAG: FkbM family methyltransferase [Acidimicrobiales bacterium]
MSELFRRLAARAGGRFGWYPYLRVRSGPGRDLRVSLQRASANYALGTNELPVQQAVQDHLRPGDVFYDIGSNIGFFALIAARAVGADGRVVAFEPVPANAKRIRANAARNGFGQIRVVEVAVGREAGGGAGATLTLSRHPGGASLFGEAPPDATGTIEVATASVDELVAAGRTDPPTLVKVDVEGTELDVLGGMRSTLASHSPLLIVELDGPSSDEVMAKLDELRSFLDSVEYSAMVLDPSYSDVDWHVVHVLSRRRPTPTG